MGSYNSAVMTGFVCRLCSELNKNVVHIYSEKGKRLKLWEKINVIPISVEPFDNLPKTVCTSCILQLEKQYELLCQIKDTQSLFRKNARRMNTPD